MAKYDVNHACGHTSTHELFGKHTVREWRIGRLEAETCPECQRVARAEQNAAQNAQSAEAAAKAGLPALEGTEKQAAWAVTIRRERLKAVASRVTQMGDRMRVAGAAEWERVVNLAQTGDPAELAVALDLVAESGAPMDVRRGVDPDAAMVWLHQIATRRSASWWIDRRSDDFGSIGATVEAERQQAEEQKAKDLKREAVELFRASVRARLRPLIEGRGKRGWSLECGTWSGCKRIYFGHGFGKNLVVLHVTGDAHHSPGSLERVATLTDADAELIAAVLDEVAAKYSAIEITDSW